MTGDTFRARRPCQFNQGICARPAPRCRHDWPVTDLFSGAIAEQQQDHAAHAGADSEQADYVQSLFAQEEIAQYNRHQREHRNQRRHHRGPQKHEHPPGQRSALGLARRRRGLRDGGRHVDLLLALVAAEDVAGQQPEARIARLAGVPVLPAVCRLIGDQYEIAFYPPWENYPTDDLDADVRRMNAFIEERIRENPEQYLWTHRRFKTRPPGEPGLY